MTKGTPTGKGVDASSQRSIVRGREQRARWPVAWRRAAPTRDRRTRVATPPRPFSIPPARPMRAQRFDKTAIRRVVTRRAPIQRQRRSACFRFNRASAPTQRPHWADAPASSPRRPIPRRPPTRSSCRRSLASNKKAPEQPDARAQSADLLRRLSNRPTAKDGGIKKAGSPPQRRRTRCVGSPSRARTCDTWINSPPLYRLSYQGTRPRAPKNRNAPQRLKCGFYRTRPRSSREFFVCGQKRRAESPQTIPRRANRRLRHSPANPRHRIADDALAHCGARRRRPSAPTNGFLARLCKGLEEITARADHKSGSRIVHVPSANGRNRMKNQDGFGFLSAPGRRAAQGWLRWGRGLGKVWAESVFFPLRQTETPEATAGTSAGQSARRLSFAGQTAACPHGAMETGKRARWASTQNKPGRGDAKRRSSSRILNGWRSMVVDRRRSESHPHATKGMGNAPDANGCEGERAR